MWIRVLTVVAAVLALATTADAQITMDGSLGPAGALAGPNYTIGSNLGQIRGSNLFHSFGQFNIQTGESATFTGPNSIGNIIGRVTGGQQSLIDGLLRSTIPGANLFLINPRGVVFGPNASLDVGGSFHISTADHIRFADGSRFHADLGQQSVLTAAQPVAFGFLGPTVAPISVQGSFLQVPDGQALTIAGGDVTITGGALTAPGGRVQIASVASAGEVIPSALDLPPALSMNGFTTLGRIELSGGVTLDTSGAVGGTVMIRGGQLVVDGAFITSNTFGDADGARPGIDLQLTESVALTNFASLSTAAFALGRGGDVQISAPSIQLDTSSAVATLALGDGRGGDVLISGGDVRLDTGASVTTTAFGLGRGGDIQLSGSDVRLDGGAFVATLTFGDGAGGDIGVNAATLTLNAGALIGVVTGAGGPGGSLTVNATQAVAISGRDAFGNTSALSTQAQAGSTGTPGPITVTTPILTLDDGGTINSQTLGAGRGGDIVLNLGQLGIIGGAQVFSSAGDTGDGGNIIVTATGNVAISGIGTDGTPSGIVSASQGALPDAGRPGDIVVTTAGLTLAEGGIIQAGNPAINLEAGNVSVVATDSILISADSGISSQALLQDAGRIDISTPSLTIDGGFIRASTIGPGRGGEIAANVGTLTLVRGGQIATSSELLATGNAGNVTVNASNGVTISGAASGLFSSTTNTGDAGSIVVTTPTLAFDGGAIRASTSGAGRGGEIVLDVSTLALLGGGQIVTSSELTATGNAGNVLVNAGNGITIAGAASGLFSTTANTGDAGSIAVSTPTLTVDGGAVRASTTGSGRGGEITTDVGTLALVRGGQVATSSEGLATGNAGNVAVAASGSVTISGTSDIGTNSGLFSTTANTGDAGTIAVSAPALTIGDGGRVSVATSGAGRAGDVNMTAGTLSVAGDARIDSGTTGAGAGGTVRVVADSIALSGGGGLFSNATAAGRGGDISVQTNTIALTQTGTISAKSSGTGDAGNITVVAADTFESNTGIVTTEATVADGGNIRLTVGTLLHLVDSQITTSVQSGVGAGGNITIDPRFVILDGSVIRADAFGGPGGNVLIVADVFLTTGSLVSASSALGVPGTIDIQATVTDLSGSVASLPESLLAAAAVLRASCATRLSGGTTSSLVVAGRDGVPPEPGGLLPSPMILAAPADPTSPRTGQRPDVRPAVLQVVFDPKCSK